MARDSLTIDYTYGNGITVNGSYGYSVTNPDFSYEKFRKIKDEYLLAPKPLVEWSK